MDNASYCSLLNDLFGDLPFAIYLPISFVSVLLCLATVAVVCKQRLHKTLVYRLAMYQVLSAIEFSILWIIASINILSHSLKVAVVLDSLLMGSSFIKLMFTLWISIHLFALAVFHKNLQRLERLYVASSLLIPLAVTIVLLGINLTGCHGYSTYLREEIVFIIIFAVLVIVSLLMVVMGTILCHRACRRRNAVLSEYDKQHKKALCEMLPLLLYPIFFLLFTMPIFGFTVHDFVTQEYNITYLSHNTTITMTEYIREAPLFFALFAPCWSFTTSLLLISHLCVVRSINKRKVLQFRNRFQRVRQQYNTEEGTHFSAPTED
ncbi:hypothetical protein EMCRGX_G003307 [Ephydatia muelleri]